MTSQIINKNKLVKKENVFHIDLQVKFPPFSVNDDEYMTLVPLLVDGKNRQELPCFLINGSRRHKGYKQMVRSLGKETVYSIYNIYKAFNGNKSFKCKYSIQINYENWMDKAQIQFIVQ
ncbi:MAG: hypothetical protein ACK5KT_13305 [Dysgonomonas sp.]